MGIAENKQGVRNFYDAADRGDIELVCFVGRVPGLALGGVHGKNEKKVYERLGNLVDEWVKIYESEDAQLPHPTAGKQYSGKFNLRAGEELHERLVIVLINWYSP